MLSLLTVACLVSSTAVSLLEPAFANTIVSPYPDGRQAKAWLNRDGSYRGQGRSGRITGGKWTIKGQ